MCYPLLALLFPEYPKIFQCDIDHMYPATSFSKAKLMAIPQIAQNGELLRFYLDKENWNTLPNLQLLSFSDNRSKNKRPLDVWLREVGKSDSEKDAMLLPKGEDNQYIIDFLKFKDFFEKRKKLLMKKLESILSGSIDDTIDEIEDDDETDG